MQSVTSATVVATTALANDITLFASLELSKSKWVVTINSPGSEKFSKHVVEGGDGARLLDLLSRSRAKAEERYGVRVKAIVIQEAGLDGFWIHRLLLANGIESQVVDAASIAVDRRHRRAKTDSIDGETLLRTLMAWARGERRVCSMVRAPSREDEDRRRLTRERGTLLKERIQHTNRVRGLLSGQGVQDYDPLRRDRFERLEALRTGDGRDLPPMLKEEIRRELDRIALVTTQLAVVERARDALIRMDAEERNNPAALLLKLKGLGPEFASLLWLESLFRSFGNRRQVAAYGGLAPSPWQSGGVERDQGISKSGNRRLRKTMIELAWFWLRHQPDSALSRWFHARVGAAKGRIRRIAIVALARKLLVALWRYVTQGVVPEGAVFKAASPDR
ncbi:MAG: IS110 family transposase [Roseiarcus sp.]|uniref:IS110 family transposase n=1 Tax=Roseiarcus sp. TaxID=1969460 RepID=UPI003C36F68B